MPKSCDTDLTVDYVETVFLRGGGVHDGSAFPVYRPDQPVIVLSVPEGPPVAYLKTTASDEKGRTIYAVIGATAFPLDDEARRYLKRVRDQC